MRFLPMAGVGFALMAALFNGTVGVLSRFAFDAGLDSENVAFWRCALALSIATLCILSRRNGIQQLVSTFADSWKIAICASLGIFTLYHFETMAFQHAAIPFVAIVVFSGVIGAIALNIFILKEVVTFRKLIAIAVVFGGGAILIASDGIGTGSAAGVWLALIAGLGYGSFIFAWKFFRLRSTLATFWWFLAYGLMMLLIPFVMDGPVIPPADSVPWLVLLGILPSFCGFYCTILSVQYIDAYKTQVIEASEPVFSALCAAIFFHELLSGIGTIAAIAIILAIMVTVIPENRKP
jgi:drug/metabolite transporter (DMT)-like permease